MGTLQFILGRAGTGKTRFCLDRVARQIRQSPLFGPGVILLVPEQATFQMSRTLANWRTTRGFIRAKIMSFKSLAQAAVNVDSGIKRPMINFSRKLLMQQILTTTRDQLQFWSNAQPDRIAGSALQILDELIQAGIGPDQLQANYDQLQSAGQLDPQLKNKLADMILLARNYLKMDMAGLDDPLAYLDRYREMIDRIDWIKDSCICVDGFSGFTGQEYAALIATIQTARNTYLTLSLDPLQLGQEPLPHELNHFAPGEQTYFRLLELAKSAGITIDPPLHLTASYRRRYRTNKSLLELEQSLTAFEPVPPAEPDRCRDTVVLVSAEDPRNEVELAAGKILHLTRSRGYRFRDISVILRSLDSYEHLIRYIFDEHDIPYFLDVRRPIAHHPLTHLIRSAVGAVTSRYHTQWMLRYLKSGMTRVPADQADRIENYVLAHGIDNERWLDRWRYRISMIGLDEDRAESTDREWNLDTLNQARLDLVEPLQSLEKYFDLNYEFHQTFDIGVLIDGLMLFLREMNVTEKLDRLIGQDPRSPIHRQVWDQVIELFEQLRLTLSGTNLSLEHFLKILTDSFAELTVGVIPPSVDQVLIGTIERSRHPSVRASLVLGFNEGFWPEPPVEDVVLTDQDRQKLAWQDLPTTGINEQHYLKEQYLTYIALTRPSEFLWVSLSRRSLSGLPLQPSRYFHKLESFCGPHRVFFRADTGSIVPIDSEIPAPVSPAKLVSQTVTGIRSAGPDDEANFWLRLAQQLNTQPQTQPLLKKYIAGLCDNNKAELSADLAQRLFSNKISFSQIESFYRCPFQHFCRFGLRLQITPRHRIDPIDLGVFRHHVMAHAWKSLLEQFENWNQLQPDQLRQIIDGAIDQNADQMKNQILLSTGRNRYILQRLREELTLAMQNQIDALGPGRFKPTAFEQEFNFPLAIDNHDYYLRGRIDRIDLTAIDAQTWVMIVDYKSRATTFKIQDWAAGVQLQLPGYLMVVTDQKDNLAAGAVFLSLVPQPPKSGAQKIFPASGLLVHQALDLLTDPERQTFPYGIKLNKDGTKVSGPVKVMPDEVVRSILETTGALVVDGVRNMVRGLIGIAPYHDGKVSICPTCDHRGVCRFDHSVNRYRYALTDKAQAVIDQLQSGEEPPKE